MKNMKSMVAIVGCLLLSGLALRVVFALNFWYLDGDTAVFGIMAKHILEGKEFPIYMPLLHYAGSISSYAGAALFTLFGTSYIAYNFVGALFSFSWVVLIFLMARKFLDEWSSAVAVAVAAFPAYQFLRHSFLTGIRAESFFFIPLMLFLVIRWSEQGEESRRIGTVWLGFFCGIGLWTTPGAMPAVLTAITLIAINCKKGDFHKAFLRFIAGFLVGYIPAIIYSFQHPSATLLRMMGKILDLDRSVLTAPDLMHIVVQKIVWRIAAIPVSVAQMPRLIADLVGAPSAAACIIAVIWILKCRDYAFKGDAPKNVCGILLIYIFWFSTFYTVLIGQAAVKYMIPLCVVSPLLIGYLVSRIGKISRLASIALCSLVLIYNCSTVAHSFPYRNENPYPAVIDTLLSKGLHYGFSYYSPAYIVQFESNEECVVSPTLFHPTYCDRWPSDTRRVRNAAKAFYMINKSEYPETMLSLEATCKKRGITYDKDTIKDFVIYYNLSSKIYPEELQLQKFDKK